jgi:Integrase core domain
MSAVSKCLVCAVNKAGPPGRQEKMMQYHPTRRFELVAVDIMEISPKSRKGNSKLIVVGDTFTRFAWAYPIKNEKVETVTRALLDGWTLRYGPPEKLLSDRGKVFVGNVLDHMCKMMGIKKVFTSSYHPQTDGFVERLNRTLCKDLASFITSEEDWDEHVAMACFRYNTSVHEATGMSPFEAMFGVQAFDFDARIGWRTFLDERDERPLGELLKALHDELYRRGVKARSAAAKQYDKAVKAVQYSVGDRVLVFYPPGLVEEGRKLRAPWMGPYRIMEKLGPVSFLLKAESTEEMARVHINRLRHFSDEIKEKESPLGGIYPDSRRLFLRILGDKLEQNERWFKLVSPGRNGFVWKHERELPEIVVKAYDIDKEDKALRWSHVEE